jgi:hypothetical protein
MDLGCVEQLDDFRDPSAECSETLNCWLIGEPEARFIERYVKGQMGIAFRRSEAHASGKLEQDGFLVQALPDSRLVGNPYRQQHVTHVHADLDEFVMFPRDVELMKGPKSFVPSFVRF